MKKFYFGSNLKMYKTVGETVDYLMKLSALTESIDRSKLELFIIPSYTTLAKAAEVTDQQLIRLGAQNMCWEDQGQFTGEISPLMLAEQGISFVMLGHSERRHVFGEDDFMENRKIRTALKHGFRTLLCVGETGQQKEYDVAKETLRTQIKIGFSQVTDEHIDQLAVAYEPVWSIGVDGTPAEPDYAEDMHIVIKEMLSERFGSRGSEIPVLYGGSVNRGNARRLAMKPSIDGVFVGRAAWQAEDFNQMIREVLQE